MTIGEQIRKLRQEQGLSQKKLGELLGVSQQMVGQYESPNANLKLDTIKKIASVLKVNYSELVNLDIMGVAEYANAGYATGLESIKAFINDGIFKYPEHEKKEFIQQIDIAIANGIDRTDKEDYYFNLEVEFSHKIMQDLLKPYTDYDITDLAELVGYFLRLNERGQSKVLEYEDDLFENKYYKANEN